MQVTSVDGYTVRCEARGMEREASLLMCPEDISAGDHVMIHLGYVTRKVSEEEAHEAWRLFDQILATDPP